MACGAEYEPCLLGGRVVFAGRISRCGEVEFGVVGEEGGRREDDGAGHEGLHV